MNGACLWLGLITNGGGWLRSDAHCVDFAKPIRFYCSSHPALAQFFIHPSALPLPKPLKQFFIFPVAIFCRMLEGPKPLKFIPPRAVIISLKRIVSKDGKQRNEKLIYITKSPSPGRFCFFPPNRGRRFLFRRGGLDKKCHCRYFSKKPLRWNGKHIFLKNKRKYCLLIAENKIHYQEFRLAASIPFFCQAIAILYFINRPAVVW